MYIAFKWLVSLSAMSWICLCSLDVFVKEKKINFPSESYKLLNASCRTSNYSLQTKNSSLVKQKITEHKTEQMFVPGCLLYGIGTLALLMLSKKSNILINFTKLFTNAKYYTDIEKKVVTNFKYGAVIISVAVQNFWDFGKIYTEKYLGRLLKYIRNFISQNTFKSIPTDHSRYYILLQKLRDLESGRKLLGQLLIGALKQNKNIQMQYQLQSLARDRLKFHIDETQKQIKEDRCRFLNFKQLFWVEHHENVFLKESVKKLKCEKDKLEKNLFDLINKVYRSDNNELKVYCTRFIVQTRENVLNTNTASEEHRFLHSCRTNISVNNKITELIKDNSLTSLITETPKLKGLPGEYVWTVKDKDGIIEKLYEYDSWTDFDSGDIIRRIRQYSVYYDKDCLLDFSKSRTILHETTANKAHYNRFSSKFMNCFTKHRFLTDSEAFRSFLQNNKQIVVPSKLFLQPTFQVFYPSF